MPLPRVTRAAFRGAVVRRPRDPGTGVDGGSGRARTAARSPTTWRSGYADAQHLDLTPNARRLRQPNVTGDENQVPELGQGDIGGVVHRHVRPELPTSL